MTNSRFEDLQKRCVRYKLKKSFKKIFILFILLAFVSTIVYLFIDFKKTNDVAAKSEKPTQKLEKQKTKKLQEVVYKKIDIPVIQPKIKEVQKPELKVVKKRVDEQNVEEEILAYDTIFLQPKINLFEAQDRNKKVVDKPKVKAQEKKTILQVKSIDYESTLLLEYKKSSSYKAALNLCVYFFEKNSFEKSIYWAKVSSKLKPSEDMPWLLYAKSKKELDKTKEAIQALELYLGYYSSSSVVELLNQYKKELK